MRWSQIWPWKTRTGQLSKVVLKWKGERFWFLNALMALHVPISMIPILSKSDISALEPLGDDAASSDTGESLMCRLTAVQFPRQNQFHW